jgi:hypothetical protein
MRRKFPRRDFGRGRNSCRGFESRQKPEEEVEQSKGTGPSATLRTGKSACATSEERRPPRRTVRDGQKAPASEGGRYKGKREGEPLPYSGMLGHLKVAATGEPNA